MRGRVPTCDVVQKRRPKSSLLPNWCSMCKSESETLNHVFLLCNFASSLWNLVLQELEVSWAMPKTISDCFLSLFSPTLGKKGKVLWRMIVHAVCWSLWLERNRRIFEDKEECLDKIWSKLKFAIAWWIFNHKMFRGFFMTDVATSLRVLLQIFPF